MSNFKKDLRDFSEDELYKNINNQDFRFVHLYSDELTRRSNERWSQRLTAVTILLFFIGIIQIFITIEGLLLFFL